MYYTGIHPLTKEPVYIPKDPHEKEIQRALMQYKNPANRKLVLEGLMRADRMDPCGLWAEMSSAPGERAGRKKRKSGRRTEGKEKEENHTEHSREKAEITKETS